MTLRPRSRSLQTADRSAPGMQDSSFASARCALSVQRQSAQIGLEKATTSIEMAPRPVGVHGWGCC